MANAANGDTITFNLPLPATITLTTGPLSTTANPITITGPGANLLTISGGHASPILNLIGGFAKSGTASVSGLTIANGLADNTVGVIFNNGPLSLTNCIISNNSITYHILFGGVIEGFGPLTVDGCTFTGNSVTNQEGVIVGVSTTTVANSTFTGNSGDAILLAGSPSPMSTPTMTVANSTVNGNTNAFFGVEVFSGATLNLQNNIIAGSKAADCSLQNGMIGVNSHNLIGDGSCSPLLSGNPMLGPLQNNGGPTPTMALQPGSPAIDAGDDSVLGPPLSLMTDQRGAGFPRLSGAHVDIGAFEVQPGPPPPPPGPLFNACLKDNTSGNLLQWNTTTGQYKFTRCSDNFTLTGTGRVALVNGIRMLTDSSTGRRINAGFNTGQLTGDATIYLKVGPGVWQVFRIHDTNPSAVCAC